MGILSGFIGGAAQAGGEILQRDRESATRKDEAQFADDLAARRQRAVMELQNQYNIDAETRGMANRATERGQIVDETVANAPRLREVKVEDAKATKRAEFDPEIQALMRKAETERLTAAEQAKLDFYSQNKTGILGQIRDTARAGNIDNGAGLRAIQTQVAQMELDAKKLEAKIPPAVKMRVEPIRDELKTIGAAISKAQAEGMFDANSDNAKGLMERYKSASDRLDALLSPYLGEKAPKADAPPAASRNGWDSDSGTVYKDGKAIGTAKSAAEARALHAGNGGPKEVPTRKAAAEPARAPAKPLFTRGAPSANYPGGEIIWNGPTLPDAPQGSGILDPKRNFSR